MDGIPAAASDVYNLQESTGGLDSQGFGLSSQSSTDTAFPAVSNNTDSPDSDSTFAFNSQVNWGCQPFAGVGKRPLVSPGSSPVKQKPRVRYQSPAECCMEAHLGCSATTPMLHSIEMPSEPAMLSCMMLKHLCCNTCVLKSVITLRTVPTTCELLPGFSCLTISKKYGCQSNWQATTRVQAWKVLRRPGCARLCHFMRTLYKVMLWSTWMCSCLQSYHVR